MVGGVPDVVVVADDILALNLAYRLRLHDLAELIPVPALLPTPMIRDGSLSVEVELANLL